MPFSLSSSAELLYSIGGSFDNAVEHQTQELVFELADNNTSVATERQGPGEHFFDHLGDLVLPDVAYGTPAARREALLQRILDKRLWVHFIRPTVVDASRRQSKFTHTSNGSKTTSAMLPIGVVVAFTIPGGKHGGLASVLDKHDECDNERLASALGMTAKVVEGLKPSIFQMPRIEALIAPFDEKHGPIQLTAPSMPSSRGSSAQSSNSGSEGTTTPATGPVFSAPLEQVLTLKLARL